MQVEMRNVEDIQPYERNPRHNDAAVEAVAASIRPDEIWAPVAGYGWLYEVSSYGRLRRASKSRMAPAGHIIKPYLSWDGYLQYGLSKNSQYWSVKAHRLVALTFLGLPPFPKAQVAHFDGNKLNNHVSNLRWATAAENEADKKRHGRTRGAPPGEAHPMAKLTVELVQQMRREAGAGAGFTSVADQYGVPRLTAYDAMVGNTWATVTDPPPVAARRRKRHAN